MDVNGNESPFAALGPGGTVSVGGDEATAFALDAVRPNPSPGRDLTIQFALATAAPARLELLDVSGRRIVAREVGTFGAGRHAVSLGAGLTLPPGLYLVRLTQGGEQRTARVMVLH